ncbi:hypothetical protein M3D48_01280 [Dermabacter vaginalis]|uniref:hypothetical protein n=1 Tax=Dermabacter TaxID=36739 RepID=UPI000F87230C|nr:MULTISPECIES: hypothetical protein [Dermabacter]MCT2149267.1 hypothetical protein [Dermabacter vaginalis]RUP86214.1 hypothetical protein D8M36_07350 [Dermabacter sp. HSID17554]
MTTTTMTKRRLAAALAAASLLVAGASGCSFGVLGSSDEKPTEQASAAAPADNSNGGDQGSGSDGANPAQGASDAGGASAGSDQGGANGQQAAGDPNGANYPAPIFTTEAPVVVKGDPNATVTASLHGLKREGETVTALYSFKLNTTVKEEQDFFYLNGSHRWTPFVIDTKNLRKHTPLATENNQERAMTELIDVDIMPGQTAYAFATFAAPPADVKTMDVMLWSTGEVAKGVEIK